MRTLGKALLLSAFPLALCLWLGLVRATAGERAVVNEARSCLGDVYDSSFYRGGPPPRGRGACTDVIYWAYRPWLDLQQAVYQHRQGLSGVEPNRDLDYRWCPFLMDWCQSHAESLPTELNWKTWSSFRPGDVVFYDDGSGGPGHVGLVSDRLAWSGRRYLIHNNGPEAREEDALTSNRIVGHFRLAGVTGVTPGPQDRLP